MEDEYIETENHPNANLLDRVEHFIRRFCVLPSEHCYVAMTLWVAHAHMIEHFTTTPRLAFISPEAASGKTRALEILHLLVPNSELSLQASPATIFRTLAEGQITLLLDEVDTIFKAHSKDDNNEYLRCLLNSGYRRGATIPRCVGPMHEVQRFPVFCAVALAGIGDLPDTIMTRSVIFNMRRRTPGEKMEGFRLRLHEDEGHDLREELKVWGENRGARVGQAWPKLPPGIEDRDAEVWEPLVAVADDP